MMSIAPAFQAHLDSHEDSVSVAIEEVKPGDWLEKVYRPEIEPQMQTLYKKPGYGPSDL